VTFQFHFCNNDIVFLFLSEFEGFVFPVLGLHLGWEGSVYSLSPLVLSLAFENNWLNIVVTSYYTDVMPHTVAAKV